MTKHKFPKSMPPEIPKMHSLVFDLPSEDYHKIEGTYSSSQFKDILDDEELFIKKYILKTIEREDVPAFGTGNYFHTGILEPHKLKEEYAVFPGKMRRGEAWDKFKTKNSKKTIVTKSQVDQGTGLMNLVKDSPVSMQFIEKGKPEVSLFIELLILNGEIYAPHFNKVLDMETGWLDFKLDKSKFKKAVKIVVKVRADSLGDGFVLDLKSTTGNARSEKEMKKKISYYNYDLSASFYLDMFSLLEDEMLRTFIWTFASKDFHNCKSYKASEKNLDVGRAKWTKGVFKLAQCIRNDFQLFDELGVLDPEFHELAILKVTDATLL